MPYIGELNPTPVPLTGNEEIPVEQGSDPDIDTYKTRLSDIRDYIAGGLGQGFDVTSIPGGTTMPIGEWMGDIEALATSVDDLTAADIAFLPAGTIVATDVQAAIVEVDNNLASLASVVAEKVTDDLAGLSVLGRASNTTGTMAAITAEADGHVLRRDGTAIDFGTVATGGIADGAVTDAKLRDSAALSVIGRAANSSGDPADIVAGTNGHVLRRASNLLGFSAMPASDVVNTPAGTIVATNVQAALNELDTKKARFIDLRGYLFGCETANNSGDATNDIDFTAGVCADYTGTIIIPAAAMTKRLDAGWSPGSGNGMRYSGAPIANATYHLYAVCKAGGADPDWFASGSADTATVLSVLQTEPGGSDYIYIRRVASIIRQSGAIRGFIQTGDVFQWAAAASDRNSTSAMSEGQLAVTVPSGIVVWPMLYNAFVGAASADVAVRIKNGDNSGPLVSIAASNGNPVFATPPPVFKTNTSAEIRYIAAIGAGSILLNTFGTYGYIDRRGRDA